MTIKDKCAIVGVGLTDYYRRGQSPKTHLALCLEAILTACDDAGINPKEIDGFASYMDEMNAGIVAPALGIPEVRFSNLVWGGGGGGSCAAIGNAAAAIAAGYCNVVAVYHGIRQPPNMRFGEAFARPQTPGGNTSPGGVRDFIAPYGLMAPGQMFALIVRRHMHLYGTTEEHLGHVAITQREHARRNPKAIRRDPMTMDDYLNSRMISEPFRLFDYCNENDGAGAVIVVSAERARDLKQKPAYIMAVAQGGAGGWGQSITSQTMPEDIYPTAGHGQLARDLYKMAGIGPEDVDVAELYDHFTGMVLLQVEDYMFCKKGESGPLAAAGGLRWDSGRIPVNTHGGNLSEVYLHATTHIVEGVRQIRGTSTSQVKDAQVALVTAGPSPVPSSSMLIHG